MSETSEPNGAFEFKAGDVAALSGNQHVIFWCPACKMLHSMRTHEAPPEEKGPRWSWENRSLQRPTLSPSLLCRWDWPGHPDKKEVVCHLFVRDGQLQYLGDCTHELAGQTVPMSVPDELH